MRRWLLLATALLFISGCENKKGAFLKEVPLSVDVPTAVQRLTRIIDQKKLTYFGTIDHTASAKRAGLNLRPEQVVLFGDPQVSTRLMECNPSIGLDLPLRILFTTGYEGETTLTYTNPEYWTLKHNIKDKSCLAIINNLSISMQELSEAIAQPKESHAATDK